MKHFLRLGQEHILKGLPHLVSWFFLDIFLHLSPNLFSDLFLCSLLKDFRDVSGITYGSLSIFNRIPLMVQC